MNTMFNTILDRVVAEDELKSNTIAYLRETLQSPRSHLVKFKAKQSIQMKKLVLIACSFVIVAGLSFFGYNTYQTPVAYLSLDINPSVEVGINAFDRVISAEGYNVDGQTVLGGCNFENFEVDDAVAQVIAVAAEKGFIAKDGSTVIAITSETDDTVLAGELEKLAEAGINTAIMKDKLVVAIQKDRVSLATRAEARTLSISPGKLKLIQRLQSINPNATIAQYKDSKVSDIMKQIKTIKKQIGPTDPVKDPKQKTTPNPKVKPTPHTTVKPTKKAMPTPKVKSSKSNQKGSEIVVTPVPTAKATVTPKSTPKAKPTPKVKPTPEVKPTPKPKKDIFGKN